MGAQVFVEQPLKTEAFRILMVDFLFTISNVTFVRAPLIRYDHIRISVEQHSNSSQKSEVRGKRSVTVEKSLSIHLEELRTNRSTDNNGIFGGNAGRDLAGSG